MGGRLTGKRVLVAGAAGGIGHKIATRWADEGARLALLDADERALTEIAATLAARGADVYPRVAAMQDEAEVAAAIAAAADAWDGLDVVVVNADFTMVPPDGPLEQLDVEQWRSSLDRHLTPTFLTFKHGIRTLRRSGGGDFICAMFAVARAGDAPTAQEGTSAAALQGFVRAVAQDTGDENVRVNAILSRGVAAMLPDVATWRPISMPAEPYGVASMSSAVAATTIELALDGSGSGHTYVPVPDASPAVP